MSAFQERIDKQISYMNYCLSMRIYSPEEKLKSFDEYQIYLLSDEYRKHQQEAAMWRLANPDDGCYCDG
jgi:hypothetical protein